MTVPHHLHRAIDRSSGDIFFWKSEDREIWKTESHKHGLGQLFSLDSGSAAMQVSTMSWLLVPGRVGWIPPRETHSMISNGNVSGWSMYLPTEQSVLLPKQPLIFPRSGLVEQIVVRIAQWRKSNISSEIMGRLLAVLADEMALSVSDGADLPLPHDSRLMKLIREFSQAPAAQHSLDHWAKEIGMSKRSLTRVFQEETGLSLGQWIQNFRVSLATEKLAAGYDVTAVALASGYTSASSFIKMFQSIVGTTPAKFRRSVMDENRVISKRLLLQNDLATHGNT
jgi:AraC-like DNA-binding protein